MGTNIFDTLLNQIDGARPLAKYPEVSRHAYHLYIFKYDSQTFEGLDKSKFVAALQAEGIPDGIGYLVSLDQTDLFRYGFQKEPCFKGFYRGGVGLFQLFLSPSAEKGLLGNIVVTLKCAFGIEKRHRQHRSSNSEDKRELRNNTMNKLCFGIVDCGVIAPLYAKAIKSLSDSALLVAVSSNIKEEAKAFGEKYRIDWYEDYHDLLDRSDVDAVCICTPSGTHAEITMEVASFGKHVLVEKSLDVSLEKIDRVIEDCEKAGVKPGVVFQLRFTKAFQMVYQAVCNERFGQLVLGEARAKTYRSQDYYKSSDWKGMWAMDGGGALMNQSIHVVDLL